MNKISVILFLALISNIYCQQCKSSNDCSNGSCCRDENGNLIGIGMNGFFPINQNQVGFCQERLGQLNEVCDYGCGCEKGLKCYRPMSGACCPPSRCYLAEYVDQQLEYWQNCKPPTCFFPAK